MNTRNAWQHALACVLLCIPAIVNAVTLPNLHKRAGNYQVAEYETAAVTYRSRPITITFHRDINAAFASRIDVRDMITGSLQASNPWSGGLGCAIVIGDVVHIFGATDWSHFGNSIIHSTLDGSFAPSTPKKIWTANQSVDAAYNCDITEDPAGFVLVIETYYGGNIFYRAGDINGEWTPVGGLFNRFPTFYAACPTITYSDGWYYLTYLAVEMVGGKMQYQTTIARSRDLTAGSWAFWSGNAKWPAYIRLISPDSVSEGISTSDFSFTEWNGMVFFVYLIGDQATYTNLRTGVYWGTKENLFSEFFDQ